jgi:hypothetical protein
MAGIDNIHGQKGKNFGAEEERQLFCSYLHISQDLVHGNGQRNSVFWERICKHFHDCRPEGSVERSARSLETKWDIIKHDVAKFVGIYGQVSALNQSGTSVADVLERSLELYKIKHPKQLSIVYLHCWTILKDVPRWFEPREEQVRRSNLQKPQPVAMKRKARESASGVDNTDGDEDDVVKLADLGSSKMRPQRLPGNRASLEA